VRLTAPGPKPSRQRLTFVGWSGMRGAVTIAAALAIPLTTHAGTPFPHRDLIVYLAFCVVLATLVLQGLSLPLVIRILGLEDDGLDERENAKARIHAADAAIERLEELVQEGVVREDTAERLRGQYEFRKNRFRARFDDGDDGEIEARSLQYQRARRELLDAERSSLVTLRNEGRISEGVMQRVQRDLDLEDSRLDV
jgi:CPA1 family monovalent cation:H+ antiporter